MNKPVDMQRDLAQAKTLEELQRTAEAIRDEYKVDHIVYHWVNSVGERFGCGTYTSDWVDRYLEKDYLYIDPVVLGCFNRFDPVNWKQLDWSSKGAREFLVDAKTYGVGPQGFTVPIRGPKGQYALFTMADGRNDQDWHDLIEARQKEVILVSHAFNKIALELEHDNFSLQTTNLSPRERSTLTLLAKGNNRAQAAQELSISENTLRVYIESARHKLGALNTTHAVARALADGQIVV